MEYAGYEEHRAKITTSLLEFQVYIWYSLHWFSNSARSLYYYNQHSQKDVIAISPCLEMLSMTFDVIWDMSLAKVLSRQSKSQKDFYVLRIDSQHINPLGAWLIHLTTYISCCLQSLHILPSTQHNSLTCRTQFSLILVRRFRDLGLSPRFVSTTVCWTMQNANALYKVLFDYLLFQHSPVIEQDMLNCGFCLNLADDTANSWIRP